MSFSRNLGVEFKDINLLELSLTHTSYANETGSVSNERLEFLGDSVLGLVCADYLYESLPDHQEGDLSRIKSMVVSEESLAEVSHKLELPKYIHIGHGEEINGGRSKKAILADAMEAIIAGDRSRTSSRAGTRTRTTRAHCRPMPRRPAARCQSTSSTVRRDLSIIRHST